MALASWLILNVELHTETAAAHHGAAKLVPHSWIGVYSIDGTSFGLVSMLLHSCRCSGLFVCHYKWSNNCHSPLGIVCTTWFVSIPRSFDLPPTSLPAIQIKFVMTFNYTINWINCTLGKSPHWRQWLLPNSNESQSSRVLSVYVDAMAKRPLAKWSTM